ncbi:MAG: glutamyl-tRNA reductase [Tepidiformaceae bacterium]
MTTAISMSHQTAPVGTRERFALPPNARTALLERAAELGGGAALLGTCNRLELYVSAEIPPAALLDVVATTSGAPAELTHRAFRPYQGNDAVDHLFRVAAGLDSLVLGEAEILGQVRTAFSEAVAAGTTDRTITHLFHSAIRTGRRARVETAIGAHSVSISALAARLADQHFDGLRDRTAIVVGAGNAGRLAASALRDRGIGRLIIANRTIETAQVLAESLAAEPVSLDAVPTLLPVADIVLTSIGAGVSIISSTAVEAALSRREGAPMLLIDIAVPRDIDQAAAAIPGVTLFDVDHLEALATENAALRKAEVAAVERIVAASHADFATWAEQRAAIPTIRDLTGWADTVRARQLARALGGSGLSPEERERILPLLDSFSRSLVHQILHRPISAAREGPGPRNLAALRELFDLDQPED